MSTYAVSAWLLRHVPADEAIGLMGDAGFTQAELSAELGPIVIAWENDPAGLCAQLAAGGISVPSVHSPQMGRRLDLPDEDDRLASVRDNIRYFGLMQQCGIPEIVIHPVSGRAGADDQARTVALSRESLKMLADVAGNAGIRLAVENVGSGGRPGSTMTSILAMIEGLGDHVGLCMDIGHSHKAGLDLLTELGIALSSGKLFTLHLHDVRHDGSDHHIPGEGCINFGPYLDMLREHGYLSGRTLEIALAPAERAQARLMQVAAVRDQWQVSDQTSRKAFEGTDEGSRQRGYVQYPGTQEPAVSATGDR